MKKKVFISIITTLICIPLFMDTPLAANNPNNLLTTPYGTCTVEYAYGTSTEQVNMIIGNVTIPTVGYVSTMTYQFTHPSTGNFTVHTMNDLTNYYLFCEGGYLVSIGTNTFTFRVDHAQTFKCSVIVNVQSHPTWNYQQFYSLTNQVITQSDTVEENMDTMVSYVLDIDGRVQEIQSNTLAIRNVLMSMSGYTADGNDNIATDMDTLINAFNISNNQQKFMTNYSYINEYNNQAYNLFYRYDHTINYRDTFMSITVTSDDTSFNGTKATSFNPGYCLLFAFSGNAYNDMIPYVANTSTSYLSYNYLGRYFNFNIYEIVWTHNQRDWISFKINSGEIIPFYFGYKNNMPSVIYNQFYSGDNPLISSIKAVENAVRNMAVNVNNLTVNATGITYNVNNTQVNNSVNTYNTDIQNVYNVENDFSNSFNTYNQQFTPDFTETMTTIQSVPSMMNNVVVNLYELPFIKYPLLLTLAGIVLIALLGV